MEKKDYLILRKSLNLSHRKGALIVHLIMDASLFSVIYLLCANQSFPEVRYFSIPLIATLMFRNFSIMHEAVHGLVSKNKLLNDIYGLISGTLCLLPFDAWRRSHLEHHFWSGNIDKDPVMVIVKVFPQMSEQSKKYLNMTWKYWIPLLAFMQHMVFWSLSIKQFFGHSRQFLYLASLVLPIITWLSLAILLPVSFSLEILAPSVLLYLVAVEVVNFPHHLRLPQYRDDTRLAIWEQHEIARSCIYPRWLARFIVLNFNYHAEHHMFPDAPWYRLEEVHQKAAALLKDNLNTDENMTFIVKNRQKPLEYLMAPGEKTPQKKGSAA